MQIFISWSGDRSLAVAEAFRAWIRLVIQAADPWISREMTKGVRWTPEMASRLEESKVGVFCLTRDNLQAPWILFEAGAISKTKDAYAFTLLLDIAPADVEQPLGQFQHTVATEGDMLRLVRDINFAVERAGEKSLPERDLEEMFKTLWPRLEADLNKIREQGAGEKSAARSERELLEEILAIVRSQDRRVRRVARLPYREGSVYVYKNGALRRVNSASVMKSGAWTPVALPEPEQESEPTLATAMEALGLEIVEDEGEKGQAT